MNEDTATVRMRGLAAACVLAMLVVIGASAWLRLSQPRPPCADWPACRVAAWQALPMAVPGAAIPAEAVVRGLHRGAASATLLMLLALLVDAWRRRPRRDGVLPIVVALLALALGLSALGIAGAGSRAGPVVLGNLLGGFAMTALSWTLVRRLGHAGPAAPGVRHGALLVALLWAVQAALGGASGLGAAGTVVPLLHALLGFAAATAALLLGLVLRRSPQRAEGRGLVALASLQLLLGVVAGTHGAPPPLVLLHNALAAAGLALCCGLALARR